MATPIEKLEIETIALEKDINKKLKQTIAGLNNEDPNETELVTSDFMVGKKPLRINIKGTLTSRGISIKKNDFGTLPNHTLGVDVSDISMENMEKLSSVIAELDQVDPSEWDIKEIFYKGKWYPKLKLETKSKYKATIIPNMSPLKAHEDLCKGTDLDITTEVGAWFTIGTKDGEPVRKCGIYFNFIKVTFDMDEEEEVLKPSPAKKVKSKA